jgi:acetyltransferase-like isoleucine patch superfamily enzyme
MIKRIGGYLKLLGDLNISKTIYFNFKVFPWHTAIQLPVYFFGPVKFASLKGAVIIKSDVIKRGMVRFGCREENIIATGEPSRLSIEGELIFKGESKFAHAIQILIWTKGQLTIGDNSWIGSFTKIVAFRSIEIGNNFLASWECQVFDTDFHFIENTKTGTIADTSGTVIVGENVWLGSRSTILKNTIIPAYCIIASGSLCNKDYSASCPPGSVIGGMPAKFIKEGVRYIDDKQLEKKLFQHFQQPQNYDRAIERNQFKKK